MALGNHTFSHEWLNAIGPDKYIADIERGEAVTGALLREHNQRL